MLEDEYQRLQRMAYQQVALPNYQTRSYRRLLRPTTQVNSDPSTLWNRPARRLFFLPREPNPVEIRPYNGNDGNRIRRTVRHKSDIQNELVVLRAQNGEYQAFEQLVHRWHRFLIRRATDLTGDAEAARDIVQDAWMAVTKGIRRLDDPARFRGWIYRVVGNKCADWIRKRKAERNLEARAAETFKRTAANQELADGMIPLLRTEIGKLPADQRTILTLFYLDEIAVREIAQVLGIPEGTVKSRLYHARKALRCAMEG